MKQIERVLYLLCILCTAVFFVASAILVLAQAFAIVTLNGPLSVSLLAQISKPAGIVSAIATVLAIVLAYMRGQMKS